MNQYTLNLTAYLGTAGIEISVSKFPYMQSAATIHQRAKVSGVITY